MAKKKFDAYVIGSREDNGNIIGIWAESEDNVYSTQAGAIQNANDSLEASDEDDDQYAIFGLTFLGYEKKSTAVNYTFEKAKR